jgi:hypothetical protein
MLKGEVENPRVAKSGVATIPPNGVESGVGLQRSRNCCAIHRFKTIHELTDSQTITDTSNATLRLI